MVEKNRSVGSLLVITGPPGAGKSSVARILADAAKHSVLIEGDAFFGFLASGAIEPWLPASNDQNTIVTKAAASAAGAFATGGFIGWSIAARNSGCALGWMGATQALT
jgi:cytidylate kinase